MKKVLLLSKYSRLGASSRLRTQQYIPSLAEHNIDVTVSPLFDDVYLQALYLNKSVSKAHVLKLFLARFCVLFMARKFDLIWIEKEIFPYFPAFFERLFSIFNIKFIVDIDDAIFHNYDLSKNKLIKFFLSKKIDTVMRLSTNVIVGNNYLAARAKKAGAKSIYVIPTVVDIYRYPLTYKQSFEIITIGWIGSPSTQKYVVDLHRVFLDLNKTVQFKLLLVGASSDVVDLLPNVNVEVLKWSEDTEIDSINRMDIGIMPLIDGPWEKGKCGYKLIQYMACGLPVVASPVGVNIDIVNINQCGFLAGNDKEWTDSLFRLSTKTEIRNSYADNGRKGVESTYSLQQQLPKIISIFSSMIK